MLSQGKFIISFFGQFGSSLIIKANSFSENRLMSVFFHSTNTYLEYTLPRALGQGYGRKHGQEKDRDKLERDLHKARGSAELWEWIFRRIRQLLGLKAI